MTNLQYKCCNIGNKREMFIILSHFAWGARGALIRLLRQAQGRQGSGQESARGIAMNRNKLIREQLEKTLDKFKVVKDVNPPVKGWIRAIRDALGMSARQLAARIGVSQQSVSRIEKDELSGSVTIKTMRKTAEALDCVFVYGFVPRQTLSDTFKSQAILYTKNQLGRVAQTMSLEAQSLPPEENMRMFENMPPEIILKPPANLWDATN